MEAIKAYTAGPIALEQAHGQDKSDGLQYNAMADEAGWRDAKFPGEGWSAAQVFPSIWGPIEASRLPPMMEAVCQ